jgi:succinate dehydrogenase / fumarate reductase cytochrome b subunit
VPHSEAKPDKRNYNSTPGRFHFALRRIHSLLGILFGGYIAVHLSVNASGFWPDVYQGYVNHIHNLEPALPIVELVTIFIPLLVHMIYGAYIAFAGVKFNTTKYNYGGNWRYFLQRWTAVILLAFILFHVGTLHKWGLAGVRDLIWTMHPAPGGFLSGIANWCNNWGGTFKAEDAYGTTVSGVRHYFYDSDNPQYLGIRNYAVWVFYLLGIWSATFHFANGLWTAAIAWGLTTTARAQKRWGNVCLGFFIIMTLIGTLAWLAFTIFGHEYIA